MEIAFREIESNYNEKKMQSQTHDQNPIRRASLKNDNLMPGSFPLEKKKPIPTIDLQNLSNLESPRPSRRDSFVSVNIYTSKSPGNVESPKITHKLSDDLSIENITISQRIFCADCKCSRQELCSIY